MLTYYVVIVKDPHGVRDASMIKTCSLDEAMEQYQWCLLEPAVFGCQVLLIRSEIDENRQKSQVMMMDRNEMRRMIQSYLNGPVEDSRIGEVTYTDLGLNFPIVLACERVGVWACE